MIFAFVSRLFVLVQYVIPKHAISRLTGTLSRLRLSWITHLAIRIFVKTYDVDMGEAAETDVRSYSSFNAFFYRFKKSKNSKNNSKIVNIFVTFFQNQ